MFLQDMFLKWWLHGPRYRWSKLRRFLFERGSLKTQLPLVANLDDIVRNLNKITPKQDFWPELFDCVSYPQRVWARGKDDCDGYAILAAALLKQLDPKYQPVLVTAMVTSLYHSHSVCVFSEDKKYRYFSNKELSPLIFDSIEDVVKNFYNKNYRLLCWDEVDPVTLKQQKYQPVNK